MAAPPGPAICTEANMVVHRELALCLLLLFASVSATMSRDQEKWLDWMKVLRRLDMDSMWVQYSRPAPAGIVPSSDHQVQRSITAQAQVGKCQASRCCARCETVVMVRAGQMQYLCMVTFTERGAASYCIIVQQATFSTIGVV